METLGGGGGCVNGGDGGMKNKRTGKDMERRKRAEGGEAKWEGTRDGGRNRLTNTKQTARENEKSRLSFLSPIFFFFLASMGNYPVNKPAVYNSIRKSRHGFA